MLTILILAALYAFSLFAFDLIFNAGAGNTQGRNQLISTSEVFIYRPVLSASGPNQLDTVYNT